MVPSDWRTMRFVGLEWFRGGTLMSHATRQSRSRTAFYKAIGTDRPTLGSTRGRISSKAPVGPFLFGVTRRRAERQSASQSQTSRFIRVLVRLSGKGIGSEREWCAVPGRGIPQGAKRVRICRESPERSPRERTTIDWPGRRTTPTGRAPLRGSAGPSQHESSPRLLRRGLVGGYWQLSHCRSSCGSIGTRYSRVSPW